MRIYVINELNILDDINNVCHGAFVDMKKAKEKLEEITQIATNDLKEIGECTVDEIGDGYSVYSDDYRIETHINEVEIDLGNMVNSEMLKKMEDVK